MHNRRIFLRNTGIIASGIISGVYPLSVEGASRFERLTVLHTNDVHSRIEVFPEGNRRAGLGGASRRATLIKQIRAQAERVVLLDCGDIIQGTPYFNLFSGEPEIKLMNYMGYDACTLGNHDFDGGMKVLSNMQALAKFPMLSANYNFDQTIMRNRIQPYTIINRSPIKIGVFGLGIKLEGLVPETLYEKTVYSEPLQIANDTAKYLKLNEQCNLVICLSHMGFSYESNLPSDEYLAKNSRHIDLILGGHTHTLMEEVKEYSNLDGARVLVNQVGRDGTHLGRIDYFFEKKSIKNRGYTQTVISTK